VIDLCVYYNGRIRTDEIASGTNMIQGMKRCMSDLCTSRTICILYGVRKSLCRWSRRYYVEEYLSTVWLSYQNVR